MDYVYKIWLSLVQGPRFSFFEPTLPLTPLIVGRYSPKSNQLLISMDQNYAWNLVLIFTLVFELALSQKLGNALTDFLFRKKWIATQNKFNAVQIAKEDIMDSSHSKDRDVP